ncbi:XdhC family protein [Nonomuraea sp. NPDC050310]|uniref:XdhC family protein n=1 Tax=Nonomuraea sp. NPDC050310 TaxID=3154935 RepID=UPI003406C58A
MTHSHDDGVTCDLAHGTGSAGAPGRRVLVAVFASPVADCLLRFAADLDYETHLYDPAAAPAHPGSPAAPASPPPATPSPAAPSSAAPSPAAPSGEPSAAAPSSSALSPAAFSSAAPGPGLSGVPALQVLPELTGADVVLTDHHRPEIGPVLRDLLQSRARWIGIMGSPRHTAPHVAALTALGVPEADIARVHRPIGLNIGSRTPAEIALATLAGLIADRNHRPGGFIF